MTIAINVRFLLKNRLEGIGNFTHHIVKNMVESHPEHTFYLIFDRPPHPDFIYSKNCVPVVVNPPARHPILWWLWFHVFLPLKLKKLNPDVFISMDGYVPLGYKGKIINVLHDINYEHFPEDLPFLVRRYYQYFFPKYARRADELITVSEFCKTDIAKQYNISLKKIHVVYNAADEGFKPINSVEKLEIQTLYSHGKPYFVFVGALSPRKNILQLLIAFDYFKNTYNTDHKLIIVGKKLFKDSEAEVFYKTMVHAEAVIFTDRIAQEVLYKVVAAAECMVYLSKFEGFGIPLIEAMACGVPVICHHATAMPEIIADAGIVVDAYNSEKVAEAMYEVISNAETHKILKEKGLKRAEAFNWEESARRMYEIIKSLT